jgi:hypothetical protein
MGEKRQTAGEAEVMRPSLEVIPTMAKSPENLPIADEFVPKSLDEFCPGKHGLFNGLIV